MTPEQLHSLVSELYAEVAHRLPADSWHCREIACIALGADRGRGGHGHIATGSMQLPSGSTWHAVYICDDPLGMVIDGYQGRVRLSPRASLGLTLGDNVTKAQRPGVVCSMHALVAETAPPVIRCRN